MLTSLADEVCGTLARLCAYVMTLALLAIGGIALWQVLPDATAMEPFAKDGWSLAGRSSPAFAVSQANLLDRTKVYEIYRHPEGGRKDVFSCDSLAWALFKNGKVAEAEKAATDALRLGTKDAVLLYHAGMIANAAGKRDRAKELLGRSLAVNPYFHAAHVKTAKALLAEIG